MACLRNLSVSLLVLFVVVIVAASGGFADERQQAIFKAIAEGSTEEVEQALQADPRLVNLEYEYGGKPLFWAAFSGRDRIIELLLKRGAKVDERGIQAATPLYEASYRGHASTVKLLLEHKADVEAVNENGHSPLYAAVSRGHEEAVNALLDGGADPNGPQAKLGRATAPRGASPLMLAVRSATARLKAKAEDTEAGVAEAEVAEAKERREKFRRIAAVLIAHPKAELDRLDQGVHAPLHVTAKAGDVELTRLLLKHGADPNVRDGALPTRVPRPHDFTPLHYAAASGNTELIALLKEHGAK